MKTITSAYNSQMQRAAIAIFVIVFVAVVASQQTRDGKPPTRSVAKLPKASLWSEYSWQFQPTGDNGPYHWRIISGSLPHGLTLHEDGRLNGKVNEQGEANFTVAEIDRDGKQQIERYTLAIETPLTATWDKRAQVSGNRIDGSIKVTNSTGRDFDLTFVVLTVNDIGRATAIGYQHFSLKQNTRDMKLPFGDTLSPGNYTVNVDVVGEEPESNMIFRTRLVTGNASVTQGP